MKKNDRLNADYPCLVLRRHGKDTEYCDLSRVSVVLGRSMKSVHEMLEAHNGWWRTMSFEVQVEDEVSRVRRAKNKQ